MHSIICGSHWILFSRENVCGLPKIIPRTKIRLIIIAAIILVAILLSNHFKSPTLMNNCYLLGIVITTEHVNLFNPNSNCYAYPFIGTNHR